MSGIPILRPEWEAAIHAYDPTLDVWWNPKRQVYFVTTKARSPVPVHPGLEGSSVPRVGKHHTLYGFLFDLMDAKGRRYEPHPNIVIAFCEATTARRDSERGREVWKSWEPREIPGPERNPTFDEIREQDVHREAIRHLEDKYVRHRVYVT